MRVPQAHHGDVLMLPDATSTCLGKVIACLRHSRSVPGLTTISFSDDDAFIHPHRLVDDLAPFAAPNVVLGHLNWAAGWAEDVQQHYGYASKPLEVVEKLYPHWWELGSRQGLYAYPVMFSASLGVGVVSAVVDALDRQPELIELQRYLASKQPTPRCDPEPDSGLGYLIASARQPLTYVDLTSTARTHFWQTKGTEAALNRSLVILHGQKQWPQQRWAACLVARADEEKYHPIDCEQATLRWKRVCRDRRLQGMNQSTCDKAIERLLVGATWCSGMPGPPRDRPKRAFIDRTVCHTPEPLECGPTHFDEPLLQGRVRAAEKLAVEFATARKLKLAADAHKQRPSRLARKNKLLPRGLQSGPK